MNRRQLLAGFVAGAAGLLVPTGVVDAAEEVERRWWALGQMPGREPMSTRTYQDMLDIVCPLPMPRSLPMPGTIMSAEEWTIYRALSVVLDVGNDRFLTVPARYTFGNDV